MLHLRRHKSITDRTISARGAAACICFAELPNNSALTRRRWRIKTPTTCATNSKRIFRAAAVSNCKWHHDLHNITSALRSNKFLTAREFVSLTFTEVQTVQREWISVAVLRIRAAGFLLFKPQATFINATLCETANSEKPPASPRILLAVKNVLVVCVFASRPSCGRPTCDSIPIASWKQTTGED